MSQGECEYRGKLEGVGLYRNASPWESEAEKREQGNALLHA